MKDQLVEMTYEIELQPGEKLTLPRSLEESIGAGRWLLTVQPLGRPQQAIRDHTAFLNGYAPTDEGLYDDAPDGRDADSTNRGATSSHSIQGARVVKVISG